VLGWQAGGPSAIDFGRGFPRFLPGEASVGARLARGQADIVLALTDDVERDVGPIRADDSRLPVAVVGARATDASGPFWPAVAIRTARLGIESGGTVLRSDGVALPVRPLLPAKAPTALEVLREIESRVHRQRASRERDRDG
jgi:formylmethanofuran dehydrogenase subunit B